MILQEERSTLEFGTGGIRGVMGHGSEYFNSHTIRRIVQGFANYILTNITLAEQRRGIVIAYDSRHNSSEFAKISAAVLAQNNIPVFIFESLTTTPMLSFTIRHLHCLGGLCITASHNPPQYNGIKIYWEHGGQIVPPQDELIAHMIQNVSIHDTPVQDSESANISSNALIRYVDASVYTAYFDDVLNIINFNNSAFLNRFACQKSNIESLSIVYTPLHGTGLKSTAQLFDLMGCKNYFIVPEQAEPDGAFPTVQKPNPEEPEALKLAIQYATERNADVVFATDPDSDRLAICIKHAGCARDVYKSQAIDDYVLFNGNQTSALLLNFILSTMQKNGEITSNHKVIKTIVTTGLLKSICDSYGVEIFDTPTGFKWIASLVEHWAVKNPEYKFLFGAEESFGYMLGNNVRDKDAIAAMGCAINMIAYYKSQKISLCDVLFEMFQKFGTWQEDLISLEFENSHHGKQRIVKIMEYFRNNTALSFDGIDVERKLDYLCSTDTESLWPKIDVLQFILKDSSQISIRPSGTEPKLKIYLSICTKPEKSAITGCNDKQIREDLQRTHDKIKKLRYTLLAQIQQIVF